MTHLDLTPFYRSAIGFDRMANMVDSLFQAPEQGQPNWPPYNIEKTMKTAIASPWRLLALRRQTLISCFMSRS